MLNNDPTKTMVKKQLIAAVFAMDKLAIIQAAQNISNHGFTLEDLDLSKAFYQTFTRAIIDLGLDRKVVTPGMK